MILEQPNDPAAERAVLAACLDSRLARDKARALIAGPDLYDPRHEAIWDAMSRLDRADRDVSAVSVMATLGSNRAAVELMPDIVTTLAADVSTAAELVRAWGIRRRLAGEAANLAAQAANLDANPAGLAAAAASRLAGIRDLGVPDTTTALTLGELLQGEDVAPDWVIPDLLERRDRLMLTGQEGLGKSALIRQIAIMAAAGMHPFRAERIKPVTVTMIDSENSESQVRRKVRPLVEYLRRIGAQDPSERVVIDCMKRMDLTTDKALAEVHHLLDATQPDIVVIGPLYRLVPRAINSDDDAAPLLAALDTIRDRAHSPVLLMEAHAGHATGSSGAREMRPRGSAALLGWPEFGFGLRLPNDGVKSYADFVPWRGQRDERAWPGGLKRDHDGSMRWLPVDPNDVAGAVA